MAVNKRDRIVENLAVAAALGLLALIVALVSLAADSRAVATERSALASAGATVTLAGHSDYPSYNRIYRIQTDAGFSYGIVFTFRSPVGSALVGAIFSPKGELLELRLLGSCASRLPTNPRDILGEFPATDRDISRAADSVRNLASSDSEAKS